MNFETIYQEFIYKRSYSRWIEKEERREEWGESIDRYRNFFSNMVPDSKKLEFEKACSAIRRLDIMPSMRSLWTAGEALERDNICGYNCSYLAIDNQKSFSEMLYILLNGTGVGFSVEDRYISLLPTIPDSLKESNNVIIFSDSKLGWAKGLYKFIKGLYDGDINKYDVSRIRLRGERLKTFGGRASGPEPLIQLLKYITTIFEKRKGLKLSSLDCHDICCYIANVVVSGGVRRSASISLSDLEDEAMRHAKNGEFWKQNQHRSLANNSAVYNSKPNILTFLREWISLIQSRSGERGIFNREGSRFVVTQIGRRNPDFDFGGNPCLEVILRSREFCNLSEVVIRPSDDKSNLCKKVRQATILGCVQSTLTNFGFIGREWKRNCEEERLLGVSLTGLRDHPTLKKVSKTSKLWLTEMKQVAIDTAIEWAKALEINTPTAITCVKPSGTVSQLVNSSSGLHPRYSPYYIRRVRVSKDDPLCQFLIDRNIKNNPEVGQKMESANTVIFDFPSKSPESAMMRDETSAIEQLEYWLMLQKYWCEHKPSVTIYVKDDEWLEVGNWVYKNWTYVSGISFLPSDDNIYHLPPYEEIDEEVYKSLMKSFPEEINFVDLSSYEKEDNTEGSKELACVADGCEII